MNRKRSLETDLERQMRLEKNRQNMKRRRQNAETQSRLEEENLSETVVNVVNQEQYLKEFDVVKNDCLHKQTWAKANVKKIAKSTQYCIRARVVYMASQMNRDVTECFRLLI